MCNEDIVYKEKHMIKSRNSVLRSVFIAVIASCAISAQAGTFDDARTKVHASVSGIGLSVMFVSEDGQYSFRIVRMPIVWPFPFI